jgi:hypothetical protein
MGASTRGAVESMKPQDYAAWQEAIQAARTRAALHTLEQRIRELALDVEVLQLRQLCGQRRRALGRWISAAAPHRRDRGRGGVEGAESQRGG